MDDSYAGRCARKLRRDRIPEVATAAPTTLNDTARDTTDTDELRGAPYNLTGAGITGAVIELGDIEPAHPDLTPTRSHWGRK